jgi:hypothetical protein
VGLLTYTIYGLTIRSPLELPELHPAHSEHVDVHIRFGQNPLHLYRALTSGILFEANEKEFLLKLPNIGSYHVTGGNAVTIEARPGATQDEVRLFLLGSVLGAILYQRGYFPMHGSSNEYHGKGLLTIGSSASGKSTLAASLHQQGYPLISDDLTALRMEPSGRCVILPGVPCVKLWKDAMDLLYEDGSFRRVRPQINKYVIPVSDSKEPEIAFDLRKMVWLTTKNSAGYKVLLVQGAQKLKVLREHLFRDQLIKGMGLVEAHFNMLSSLANQVSLYHVERPSLPLNADKLTELVVKEIIGN